ncbi:MAG: HipA domain-containing protein [Herbaspirillum sp.]|nr:HipA domain-containing protein [Herbaspirillum sp.]
MNRTLHAYIDDAFVGSLSENTGVWSFQYDQQWVQGGYALSPGLPLNPARHEDTGTYRPVQWFFDNLLPEDAARQQLVASMDNSAALTDAWALLAHFGAESAGALTLLEPGKSLPEAGLVELTDDALNARIDAMPRQALAAKAPKKMSLAGAQQKLPVVMLDGKLYEPTGSRASTHILKPDSLNEYFPDSAVNEWFTARLAQRMGLPVPEVSLKYVPSPVYIIQRFDRQQLGEQVVRLHTLDALQLLSLAAYLKYDQSGIKALTDVLEKCRTVNPARAALFRWTLFNILTGNSDAHLKNISLIADAHGYELAPHYDMVSIEAWSRPELLGAGEDIWPDRPMSFPIGDAKRYGELSKAHLQQFARDLGLGERFFNREFARMVGGIEAAAVALIAEYEARTDVPPHLRASQLRMLRAIQHIPLTTMVKQLGG